MKWFIPLVVLFFIVSCTEDSSVTPGDTGSDGQAGSLAQFITVGDYLYTIDEEMLSVFDISTLSELTFINEVSLGNGVETIFNSGDHLFFGTNAGMLIYNIENRRSPQYVSTYEHVESCDPVVVSGQYAYLTLRRENFDLSSTVCFRGVTELQVIDISDLQNPQVVNTYQMNNPIGLGVFEDDLFVCDTETGLNRFDISQAPAIEMDTTYTDVPGHDLIINDQLMMIIASDQLNQFYVNNENLDLTATSTINY